MTCNVPPFASAVLAEASRISPKRRTSSDGVCGDAAHQAQGSQSDHNPSGPNNYAHAVDISQSMPGAPFWQAGYGLFNAHMLGDQIGARMLAGYETRVKYLVSHNYQTGRARILDPVVSRGWRDQPGDDHASHLHVSFTVAAEQSTAPFFAVNPAPSSGGTDVLIATNPNGGGYICVDTAGHVYAYGVAFHGGDGSLMKNGQVVDPGTPGAAVTHVVGPVTGAAMTSTSQGYFLINAAGQVYAFGDARKLGDPAGDPRT